LSFCHSRTVRFADVDAAGIVYYPRLLDYCHIAFEEFFDHLSSQPYSNWVQSQRRGFPTRRLECDFLKPVVYGSTIAIEVSIGVIGKSSVQFRFRGAVEGAETSFEAQAVKVCIDLDEGRPTAIPEELRTLFESHQEEE